MDIHAPEGPTNSFRDFAIHIAIVTVGILIALGLDGLREMMHERHLVRETRENFRTELQADYANAEREAAAVRRVNEELDKLLQDLPTLVSKPQELRARVESIQTSGYFFGDSSWQAALSTGALAHMSTQEVTRDASAFQGIREYTNLERGEVPVEFSLRAFVTAHNTFGNEDIATLMERILLMRQYLRAMRQVGEEMQNDLSQALAAS